MISSPDVSASANCGAKLIFGGESETVEACGFDFASSLILKLVIESFHLSNF